MRIEPVEAVGPFGVRTAEPVVHRKQAIELKTRRPALAVAGATHETSPLQHLEVLCDGRLGQRRGRRELHDSGFAGCEALKDRPAGGIGKSTERAAQGVIDSHYR